MIVGRSDYLSVNVPLWFILCLIVIQIIYYFMSRLNRWLILGLAIAALILRNVTSEIPTPFMINNALYWIGFFAVGNLSGRYLIGMMKKIKNRITVFIVSTAVIIVFSIASPYMSTDTYKILYSFEMFAVFGLLFAVCSFFDGWKIFAPVRFLGQNSLGMLCMHIPVLIVFARIANILTGYNQNLIHTFISAVLTCIVCYFLIIFCNRYCPVIVGKSPKKQTV